MLISLRSSLTRTTRSAPREYVFIAIVMLVQEQERDRENLTFRFWHVACGFTILCNMETTETHTLEHLIHFRCYLHWLAVTSRSVQSFFQGSLLWQRHYSVGNNRPHLRTQFCGVGSSMVFVRWVPITTGLSIQRRSHSCTLVSNVVWNWSDAFCYYYWSKWILSSYSPGGANVHPI